MSYFSTALTRIADRNQLRQADIVRDAGLTRSHVSRLCSGDQKTITDEDLSALLRAFRDQRDQAELTAARCMDVRTGPAAQFVEIKVSAAAGAAMRSEPAKEFPVVELSHETERALAWLRSQCPINPDLEKHLVATARMMGLK